MEINDLIIKFLSNNCSSEEIQLLKNLLAEDEENRKIFEETKKVWQLTSDYSTNNINDEDNFAWQKIKDNIKPGEKISIPVRFFKLAALWILLMGFGALIFYIIDNKTEASQPLKICEINTPLGSRAHIILSDGSEVWLNADTKLKYPEKFDNNQRNIYLTGEAFFKVKSNKKWPFVVHTSDVKIKALGTSFNVKAYPIDKTVTATLVEGIIKFESSDTSKQTFTYTLQPKTKLTYSKSLENQPKASDNLLENIRNSKNKPKADVPEISKIADINITENVNTLLSTSWKDPRWVIQGEKLDNLAVMLERRFDIRIILHSQDLGGFKFSGIIENETLEQVLNYLKLANPIKYKIRKGYVDISINENLKENYTTYLKKKI
jgi:ferric-dicitrate binding protein FerR (iron transport regulator)